jgi:hypothetical protein
VPTLYNRKLHNVPAGVVNIGRPSKWGNDWSHLPKGQAVHKGLPSIYDAVFHYAEWLVEGLDSRAIQLREALIDGELTGKDLVCWCVDKNHNGTCHGRVLMTIANAPDRNEALIEMRRKVSERASEYGPRCTNCEHHFFGVE